MDLANSYFPTHIASIYPYVYQTFLYLIIYPHLVKSPFCFLYTYYILFDLVLFNLFYFQMDSNFHLYFLMYDKFYQNHFSICYYAMIKQFWFIFIQQLGNFGFYSKFYAFLIVHDF